MVLDLKNLFLNDGDVLPFSYKFSLASTDINGFFPFVSPLTVTGRAQSNMGAVQLDAKISFDFSIPCDRCAAEISTHYDYDFHHMLVQSLTEESSDVYLEVPEGTLDLDQLLREDILLELPTKHLCKPDCKGLCPQCGKNLNDGSCQCVPHGGDPRLEVLKHLID